MGQGQVFCIAFHCLYGCSLVCAVGTSCTLEARERSSSWTEITLCSPALYSPSRHGLRDSTCQTLSLMVYVWSTAWLCLPLSLLSAHQELVEDKLPNGVRPRYLVYDIMQLSGRPEIARCDHATRLQCIQDEVIGPRDLAVSCDVCTSSLRCQHWSQAQHGSLDKQAEPFSVRLKQFWDVKETRWVFICGLLWLSVAMVPAGSGQVYAKTHS